VGDAFVPVLRVGDFVPEVALEDQFGKPLSLRRESGPSVVAFVYTRCTDDRACPLVTAKFGVLQRLLRGTRIRLLELTLDAAYDRPLVLRRYALAAGATDATRWALGTGAPGDLFALSERFGIVRSRAMDGSLGHSSVLAIVSGAGAVQALVDSDEWSPNDVAAEARAFANVPADPLRRLSLALFSRVSAACGGNAQGGFSLLSTLAIFASLLVAGGWFVGRLFITTFS
jgi:cytochrome oxidase Cu insertion factor (SCO1/SenC/PrrC family)